MKHINLAKIEVVRLRPRPPCELESEQFYALQPASCESQVRLQEQDQFRPPGNDTELLPSG
jgi:hypothetical protein